MDEREREHTQGGEAGPPDVETPKHFELRRAREAQLVGTADRAVLAEHIARARAERDRARREGPIETLHASGLDARRESHLVTDDGKLIRVERARAPGGPPTFAVVDALVHVRADGPNAGVLRIPVDTRAAAGRIAESLRLARWDEAGRRFYVLPGSSVLSDQGFVIGRVSRPGTYGVAGLPNDDRILTTIEVLRTFGDWLGPGGLPEYLPKICGLILCAGPDAGGLCEQCLGGAGQGIDLDLFGLLQARPGIGYLPGGGPIPPRCDEWESAGPNDVPGRINALVIDPVDPKVLYAGAAAGGVFKTTDRGGTWTALWDDQLSLAIGGLGISASAPNILYAATGEWVGPGALNNHFPGVGVYRTSNRGSDWDLLARIPSTETNAVAVDPTDPNVAYVAGTLALHRTRNGGTTWDVTSGNTNGVFDGLVTDVVVDPADAMRVYIGVHNDGVWRSADGGNSWMKLTNGLGSGAVAIAPKIALGRNGAHGTKFVTVLMDALLFTSIDGGNSFTQHTVAYPNVYGSAATWCTAVAVDPTDEQVLIAGRAYLVRSGDGGATWAAVGSPPPPTLNVHLDQQAVVFDPANHDRVFVATDGGVFVSTDNGMTWTPSSFGLVTTQCWMVSASADTPTPRFAMTTQDNSCYRSIPGSFSFQEVLPQEGGIVKYHPTDPLVVYANTWYDNLKRSLDGSATWTVIETNPYLTDDIAMSRQDPQLLLVIKVSTSPPLKRLHRSTDRGATWTQILAAPNYPLTTVVFSPLDDTHAYVGSALGDVFHSDDQGQTFWALSVAGLPAAAIRRIVVDWREPKRFYVAFGGLGIRHLWRGDIGTTVTAVTWTDVSGRLPALSLPDLAITGIALHPVLEDTIFVSHILGVHRSVDGGASWAPYDSGLPHCFVSDLDIRAMNAGATLFASTMGRGIYRRTV